MIECREKFSMMMKDVRIRKYARDGNVVKNRREGGRHVWCILLFYSCFEGLCKVGELSMVMHMESQGVEWRETVNFGTRSSWYIHSVVMT